jgi:TP53 regulating kinase-like protein
MKPKIIQQGAEAIISLENNQIIKNRVKKGYRLPALDEKLRKKRTKSEAKIIEKLNQIINVPKIISVAENEIMMEFLDGKKLSQDLESLDYKSICKKIAETIAKLHDQDIIHGDLTTSNMIFKDEKVYLIDFGLAFHSHRIEDKAVDLHLIKQALDAKHFSIAEECFKIILENYNAIKSEEIIDRIKKIESRGRYKERH